MKQTLVPFCEIKFFLFFVCFKSEKGSFLHLDCVRKDVSYPTSFQGRKAAAAQRLSAPQEAEPPSSASLHRGVPGKPFISAMPKPRALQSSHFVLSDK